MKTCGLIILCGIPGSGKTLVAQQLCQNQCDLSQDQQADKSGLGSLSADSDPSAPLCPNTHFVHICYDKILPSNVEADIIGETRSRIGCETEAVSPWKLYRRSILKCVDRLLASLCGPRHLQVDDVDPVMYERFKQNVQTCEAQETQAHNVVLVVDDNMYYTSMRYEYYQLARKYRIGFSQCYVDCNLETALKRNKQRSQQVTQDVILAMKSKFEAPHPFNQWENFTLTVKTDAENVILSALCQLVLQSLESPAQPLVQVDVSEVEESRMQCSTNVIHQSDQILRHLVASHMSAAKNSGQDLKELARKINLRRMCILEKLKNGQILLPLNVQMAQDAAKDKNSPLNQFIQRIFEDPTS